MSFEPQFQITDAGLAAHVNFDNDGLSSKIVAIAFGDGNGAGRTPSANETALVNERERIPVTRSFSVGSNTFTVGGTVEPTDVDGGYTIREIGVLLEDGTMVAVWSDPAVAWIARGPGASFDFDFITNFSALPSGSIEVTVTPGGARTLEVIAAQDALLGTLAVQQMKQRIAAAGL